MAAEHTGVTVADLVGAIGELAARRKRRSATRHEIAKELVVEPDDISQEKKLTGPLLQAVETGFVEEDPNSRWYWQLTDEGVTALDSAIFMR
jgi:hypothetical protein